MCIAETKLPPFLSHPPSPPHRNPTAWLSRPELMALAGLPQVSQGSWDPIPWFPGGSQVPAAHPDPAPNHLGPKTGQSCPHDSDLSLQTPSVQTPPLDRFCWPKKKKKKSVALQWSIKMLRHCSICTYTCNF